MAGEVERYATKLAELQKAKKAATDLFRTVSSLGETFGRSGRPAPIVRLMDNRVIGSDGGERVSIDLRNNWPSAEAVGSVLEIWYELSGEVLSLYRSVPSELRSTVSSPDEFLVPGSQRGF
jgi:hypothetical protein